MATQEATKSEAGPESCSLRLTRTFEASREAVFRAWTDPAEMAKWWGPEGMTTPICEVDARPGGALYTCMRSESGEEHYLRGVFREVTPPERLVFTWVWQEGEMKGLETVVTVEFHDRDGATELVLTHEGFPAEAAREAHNEGWVSSFVCLTAAL